MAPNRKRTGIVLVVLGLSAFAIGFGLAFGLPSLVYTKVHEKVVWPRAFGDGGGTYYDWLNNDDYDDPPYYQYIFIYNITNPDAFLYNAAAPAIAEVGPYVFQYVKRKIDLSWDATGEYVTFREYGYQVFQPSLTARNLNPFVDTVYQINLIFTGAMQKARLGGALAQVLATRVALGTAPAACASTTSTNPVCAAALAQLPEFPAAIVGLPGDQALFLALAPSISSNVMKMFDALAPTLTDASFKVATNLQFTALMAKASLGTTIYTQASTLTVSCSSDTTGVCSAGRLFQLNPTLPCSTLPDISPLCTGGAVDVAYSDAVVAYFYKNHSSSELTGWTWTEFANATGILTTVRFSDPNSILYQLPPAPAGNGVVSIPNPTAGVFRWLNPAAGASLAAYWGVSTAKIDAVRTMLQAVMDAYVAQFYTGMQTFFGSPPSQYGYTYPSALASTQPRDLVLYQFGAGGVLVSQNSVVKSPAFPAFRSGFTAATRIQMPFPAGFDNWEIYSYATQKYTFPSEIVGGTMPALSYNNTKSLVAFLGSSSLPTFVSAAVAMKTAGAAISPLSNTGVTTNINTDVTSTLQQDYLPVALPAAAFYFALVKSETGTPAPCAACDVAGVNCAANTYMVNASTTACYEWIQSQSDFATRAINNASSPANGNAAVLTSVKSNCGGYLAGGVSASLASANPAVKLACLGTLYTAYTSRFVLVNAMATGCAVASLPTLSRDIPRALFGPSTTVRDSCIAALNQPSLATPVNAFRQAMAAAAAVTLQYNFDLTSSWPHGGALNAYETARVNIEVIAGYVSDPLLKMVGCYFNCQNKGLVVKHTVADFALGGFADDFWDALTQGALGPTPGFTTNYTSEAAAHVFAPTYTYNTGAFNRALVGNYHAKNGLRTIAPTYYPLVTLTRPDLLSYHGSDGTQFPPASKQNVLLDYDKAFAPTAEVWVTQVGRTVTLVHDMNYKLNGILLNRFHLHTAMLAVTDPVNQLYGVTVSGVQPVTNDRGFQSWVSLPRFYQAAPALLALYPTLPPANDLEHDSYLGIEPITGATMQARKRLQGNLGVESGYLSAGISGLYMGYNVSSTYKNVPIPYYYISEQSELTHSQADDFKKQVYGAAKAATAALVIGIVTGVVMCTVGVVLLAKHGKGDKVMAADGSGAPTNDVQMESVQYDEGKAPGTAANAWA
eukprot:Opistho-1_new@81799